MNIKGRRFHRLKVLRDGEGGKNPTVVCLCDCGRKVTVLKGNLLRGNTKSCGCWKAERFGKISKERHRRRREEEAKRSKAKVKAVDKDVYGYYGDMESTVDFYN
jgi:hypothetical protein